MKDKQITKVNELRAQIEKLQKQLYCAEHNIDIDKYINNYVWDEDNYTLTFIKQITDIDIELEELTVNGTEYSIGMEGDYDSDEVNILDEAVIDISNVELLTKEKAKEKLQKIIAERTNELSKMVKQIDKAQ